MSASNRLAGTPIYQRPALSEPATRFAARHSLWLEELPGHRKAFWKAQQDVRDAWDEHLAQKPEGREGACGAYLDADGNLKMTRTREDSGLLRMHMQTVNPQK